MRRKPVKGKKSNKGNNQKFHVVSEVCHINWLTSLRPHLALSMPSLTADHLVADVFFIVVLKERFHISVI